MPEVQNAIEAFAYLEKSFKKTFPEVREGFTWSEAISRAKQLPLDINWEKVEKELVAYESYRYGGNDRQKFDTYEILKLGIFLRSNVRKKNKKKKKQEVQKTTNIPMEARLP